MQIHHIITDGWSMKILTKEIEYLYKNSAIIKDDQDSSLHFIEYALAQRISMSNGTMENKAKHSYWDKTLRNVEIVPFLPPDWLFSDHQCGSNIRKQFSVSIGNIQSFCKEKSITEFVFAFTGLLVAIYALNGSDDITAFLAVSSRDPNNKETTGPFVNVLPLRTSVDLCTNL